MSPSDHPISLIPISNFIMQVIIPSIGCLPVGYILSVKDLCSVSYLIASFKRTARAPATPRSSAVTGFPERSEATTMLPRRRLMSSREVVSARMAMISLATVISNWQCLSLFFSVSD